MAGIGNVYKSELLFIHSVNPWAPVGAVRPETQQAIIATARKLLVENVQTNDPHRITTRGDPTARGASVYVYGRAGRPCRRCGTPIRTRRQGALNRPTYWCPRCQPALHA
jgi:endonuclease-8